MNKRKYIFLFFAVIVVVSFNSCTIKKRSYQPGYYVDWHNSNVRSKTSSSIESLQSCDYEDKEVVIIENEEGKKNENINFTDNKIRDFNQPEVGQDFEPIFALNNQDNYYEIILASSKTNDNRTILLNGTPENHNKKKNKTKLNHNSSKAEAGKLHWAAVVGIVFTVLGYGFIPLMALAPGLGFVIFCLLASPASILLGFLFSYVALADIKYYANRYEGETLAKTGLVLCLAYAVIVLVGMIL